MKKIITLLVILVVMSFSVFSWGATRSITGDKVTITVDTTGTIGFTVMDTLPVGTSATNVGQDGLYLPNKNNVVRWIKTGNDVKTFTYSTTGSGQVTGVITGGDPASEKAITGDSAIPKPTGSCVPSWVEGSWSTCTNGQQTRTVTDKNNCSPVPVNKPATSQTCTVTPSSSDCVSSCYADQQACLEEGTTDECNFAYNTCASACAESVTLPAAQCGNNKFEAGEVCDGTDLAGNSCASQGYASGIIACGSNCLSFDTSKCVSKTGPVCGNGKKESGEQCDGADLGTQTCVTGGALSGTLSCKQDCTVDVSQCQFAGQGGSNGIAVTAENQQEADLFKRIHDALEKNSGSPLKQISSVAGVFQCYFKSDCDLATYQVK